MADQENIPQVPSLNPVLNRLKHEIEKTCLLVWFANVPAATDTWLEAAGRNTLGIVMPQSGYMTSIASYDQYSSHYGAPSPVNFSAGDWIQCKAVYNNPWFDIYIYKNGVQQNKFTSQGLLGYTTASLIVIFTIPKT